MKVRTPRVEVVPGFNWTSTDGRHVIACGDSRECGRLEDLVDDRAILFGDGVDLVLLDPPYNVSSTKKIRLEGRKHLVLDPSWDLHEDDAVFWRSLRTIVKSAHVAFRPRKIWVWTSDWWISPLKFLLKGLGYRVAPSYHWCKTNPMPSVRKKNCASAVEYLVMAFCEHAYFDLDAFPKQRNWVERSVVSQKERIKLPGTRDDVNPTQKPLDLIEVLVRAGVPKDGLVVDTCGGTGTTSVAAVRTGRRSLYVDLDAAQVRVAGRRVHAEVRRVEAG